MHSQALVQKIVFLYSIYLSTMHIKYVINFLQERLMQSYEGLFPLFLIHSFYHNSVSLEFKVLIGGETFL